MPPTSQLDWLSSTTAMIVLFWSRVTRDLLKSFGWGIAALHRLNAASKLPFPRRPPHSIFRFRASGDTPHRPRGEAASHRSRLPLSPDFSYRVRFRAAMTCATAEPIEKNGGCGLDRRVTTFASPYGRNGPPGWFTGVIRAALSGSSGRRGGGKRGVSDVVLGLIRKGSRHGELDAAHAG